VWAIGQPDRPALSAWPLLGALAARTRRLVLGPLVARVSLEPGAVLAHHVETMLAIVGRDRLIAGLGAGDKLSQPENEAYGIPFPPTSERLETLEQDVTRCTEAGARVWVGGRSPAIRDLARRTGAALNLWGVAAREVAATAPALSEVTWGGVLNDYPGDAATLVDDMRLAGASWAVIAPAYRPGEPPKRAIKTISDAVAAT
jgi:alkanesulfonate monooxygenase SsuD/methylene tetrahydromethanopterin reductase-like flavin-dependent oxidoreductase (luciferase family)